MFFSYIADPVNFPSNTHTFPWCWHRIFILTWDKVKLICSMEMFYFSYIQIIFSYMYLWCHNFDVSRLF
jgi:hypothetical protein